VPYRSANPATGELLKTFVEHTDQEMMEALATADKAQRTGKMDHVDYCGLEAQPRPLWPCSHPSLNGRQMCLCSLSS
jgi:hypothetical protein